MVDDKFVLALEEYPYNNIVILYELDKEHVMPEVMYSIWGIVPPYRLSREIHLPDDEFDIPRFENFGEYQDFGKALHDAHFMARKFYFKVLKDFRGGLRLEGDIEDEMEERILLVSKKAKSRKARKEYRLKFGSYEDIMRNN